MNSLSNQDTSDRAILHHLLEDDSWNVVLLLEHYSTTFLKKDNQ